MLFLLDTNAVTDAMHHNPSLLSRLAACAAPDAVATCAIVRGEILFGIERLAPGKRQSELRAKAGNVLAGLPCQPVSANAADHYSRIKRACQRKGFPLDENDLWIAATALALGATLVTRDLDFQQVDGLTVTDWTV